jgi:DNA processing protein
LKYLYWLACRHEVKRRHRINFLTDYPSAKKLFYMTQEEMIMTGCFLPAEITVLRKAQNEKTLDRSWEQLKRRNIGFVGYGTEGYPKRLMQIPDPPVGIFYRGNLPEEGQPAAAVVGARMCTEYGRSVAAEIGKRFAKAGVAVISGMARGIDSASHAGALQGGGKTYAVLGCGCDVIYPKSSRALYENILADGGGILSEYVPGTQPLPYFFPERNRLISGLSDLLIVAEAKERSGSLITADCALEQGLDVYAVPGRIGDRSAAGCNRLIWQGASILYDLDAFFSDSGLSELGTRAAREALTGEERTVYDCLELQTKSFTRILEESGSDPVRLSQVLSNLKEYGLVREDYRNYFSRCL